MSFLRPEAVNLLRRYAEPAIYAVLAVVLIREGYLSFRSGAWVGLVVMAIGCVPALAVIGRIERAVIARRSETPGPGVVGVEEGRISYFGPFGGGVMAIDALVGVAIRTTDAGPFAEDIFWELTDETGVQVLIPTGAENAAALLDVLEVLPGFKTMAVVHAMGSTENARFQIWRRGAGQSAAVSSS